MRCKKYGTQNAKLASELNRPGYYILGITDPGGGFVPLYVGRSDTCLVTRLLHHELKPMMSHFYAVGSDTIMQAYLHECMLFHRYRDQLLNDNHPDSPDGTSLTCPQCHCGGKITTRAVSIAQRRGGVANG